MSQDALHARNSDMLSADPADHNYMSSDEDRASKENFKHGDHHPYKPMIRPTRGFGVPYSAKKRKHK